ncbi:MAG: hypothetical protein DMF81_10210, partial [Acidobacteria bacterium]
MRRRRRTTEMANLVNGQRPRRRDWFKPFLWGVLTAGSGMVIANALASRRRTLDLRLLRGSRDGVAPVVVVPGIMGSRL